MLLFTAFVVVTVAVTVLAAVSIAGNHRASADRPTFPRPEGYVFHDWHLAETLRYCIDPIGGPDEGEPLLDIAQRAIGGWQYVADGKIPIEVVGLCPGQGLGHGDGFSVIGWAPLEDAIGMAHVRSDASGIVTEADITLESIQVNFWPHCLLSVLLHEVGHAAGLAHQLDGRPSIMQPSSACDPHLSWRDILAIRFLYN